MAKTKLGQTINGMLVVAETPGVGPRGSHTVGTYTVRCSECGFETTMLKSAIGNLSRARVPCRKCRERSFSRTPEGSMYARYKINARGRGISFDLTEEEFAGLLSNTCTYCGGEGQERWNNSRTDSKNYCGLDRVDSSGPYAANNCVPCCYDCNKAKSNMPEERFRAWIGRLVKHNK